MYGHFLEVGGLREAIARSCLEGSTLDDDYSKQYSVQNYEMNGIDFLHLY